MRFLVSSMRFSVSNLWSQMRFLVSSLWSQMRFLVSLGSRGKQSCTVPHVLLTATTTCRDEEEASAVSLVSVWNCFSFLFFSFSYSTNTFFYTCFRFGGCQPSFPVTRCFLCPLFLNRKLQLLPAFWTSCPQFWNGLVWTTPPTRWRGCRSSWPVSHFSPCWANSGCTSLQIGQQSLPAMTCMRSLCTIPCEWSGLHASNSSTTSTSECPSPSTRTSTCPPASRTSWTALGRRRNCRGTRLWSSTTTVLSGSSMTCPGTPKSWWTWPMMPRTRRLWRCWKRNWCHGRMWLLTPGFVHQRGCWSTRASTKGILSVCHLTMVWTKGRTSITGCMSKWRMKMIMNLGGSGVIPGPIQRTWPVSAAWQGSECKGGLQSLVASADRK